MSAVVKHSENMLSAEKLAQQVRAFVDEEVIPNEPILAKGGDAAYQLEQQLSWKARSVGLWGTYYPLEYGGKIACLESFLAVAEQEGRTEFSQSIFGTHSALDAHMLHRYGSEAVREKFLLPMAAGQAIPAYAMTEPDHGGSFPNLIASQARLADGYWQIDAKKWFVCNTDRANFVTVLVRTGEAATPINQALSMIVVPTDAPGFEIKREISMLGRFLGQGEMLLNGVKVPEEHVLGRCGSGIDLMRTRLTTGRLLRSMNWVGLAQRCFDLMGARINSDRGLSARLPDKQLVRQHMVKTHQAIYGARLLIMAAARGVDSGKPDEIAVNIAKMAASQAICIAADSAMQLHGAEGISDLTPIAGIFRIARTSRILDGSDESLTSSIGRQLIDFYKDGGAYEFD